METDWLKLLEEETIELRTQIHLSDNYELTKTLISSGAPVLTLYALISQAKALNRIADLLEKLLAEKTAPSLHARPLVGHDSWGAK